MSSLLVVLARIVLAGIAFLLFWTGAAMLSWIVLPIVRFFVRRRWARARACQSLVQRAFRLFHGFLHRTGLLDYDYRQVKPIPAELAGRPFVMVANHPSLIDVTAIVSAWDALCVVAKRPLFTSVLVGPLLRCCDHIDGGDGSAMSGAAVIDEAHRRLHAGLPVLIFPEGTRSPTGSMSLRPFKRGAFEIACRAGVPILPVVLRLDRPILLKKQRWRDAIERQRVRLTVELLSPIAVSELNVDSETLARRVEALFRDALGLETAPLLAVAQGSR